MRVQSWFRPIVSLPLDLGRVVEETFDRVARAATGVVGGDLFVDRDAASKTAIQDAFKARFGAMAASKREFHALMREVYGAGYDRARAEEYRRRALAGDYSWLPPIEFVDGATLNGASAAYDARRGIVYLSRDVQGNLERAAQTYIEEVGHHLDARLNRSDSRGDEGELFRRLLSGERLSASAVAAIRNDDDRGVIYIDGRAVKVEFRADMPKGPEGPTPTREPQGRVGSSARRREPDPALQRLGDAFLGLLDGMTDFSCSGGRMVAGGVGDIFFDSFSNLLQGRVTNAIDAPVRGLDRILLQAPERFVTGLFDGLESFVRRLDPTNGVLADVSLRVLDSGRTAATTAFGILRDGLRVFPDMATGTLRLGEVALRRLFRGDFGGAAVAALQATVYAPARFVGSLIDASMRTLQGLTSIVSTMLWLQPPSRALTDHEKEVLRRVYGDSLDVDSIRIREGDPTNALGMAPHTVGNTIYLPAGSTNASGNVFSDALLVHEAAHAWQNQNGGGDYITSALFHQLLAAIFTGDRSGAYDWRSEIAAGRDFEELNPEQQAEMIEDISVAMSSDPDGDGVLSPGDFVPPLTGAEWTIVQAALERVRAGDGAP